MHHIRYIYLNFRITKADAAAPKCLISMLTMIASFCMFIMWMTAKNTAGSFFQKIEMYESVQRISFADDSNNNDARRLQHVTQLTNSIELDTP